MDQVMKEFKALLDRGVFEVILIAQDLGDFGKDRGKKGELASLLREMMKEPRNFWLRLLYLYPDEIDDELIQVMKSDPRICPYLDMPIQHINDEILASMHRKTSRSQIIGDHSKVAKRDSRHFHPHESDRGISRRERRAVSGAGRVRSARKARSGRDF